MIKVPVVVPIFEFASSFCVANSKVDEQWTYQYRYLLDEVLIQVWVIQNTWASEH